jgi:ankyrin repeat protein
MNSLIEKNAEYTIESNYTLVQNGTKKINDQNINALDAYDKTPLMWAVQFGKTEIVKELLAKGADVNFKNSYAMTALYYCNDANIIKTLISNGADINSRDKQGQTAFMNAASGINTAKMEALFNINNDVINIKDDHGYTPLMLTLQKSQQGINYDKIIKAVDFLLEKGADITIKNNDNNTALEMVIFSPDHNDDFKIQFIQTLCDKDKINIKQIFENKKIAEGFKMKFIQAACKNGKITGDELIEKLYDNQNIDSDTKNKFLTALFQDKTINKDFKYKLFSNLNDAGKISEVQQHDYQNCINISSSKSTFAER